MKRTKLVSVMGAALLLLSACGADDTSGGSDVAGDGSFGEPGDAAEADTTIEIIASDGPFRFEPDEVEVAAGDTVVFELLNVGGVEHELGILAEPTEGAMTHDHSGDPSVTPRVEPGGTAEVVWTFTEPGEFVFECHVDAHHLAGMRGTITVSG